MPFIYQHEMDEHNEESGEVVHFWIQALGAIICLPEAKIQVFLLKGPLPRHSNLQYLELFEEVW